MADVFARIWADLGGRIDGPFWFRVILQPMMATFFAVKAGVEDAREGRRPYFWSLATDPADRRGLLLEWWKAVAYIFLAAIAIDLVYQVQVFGRIYLFELLLVGVLLACVPYLVVRGLVTRVVMVLRPKVRP